MADLVLVISFVTYTDWSNTDDPDDLDIHTEDTDKNVVGCARTPEEAAVLVSRALAARPPCDEEEEDGPNPIDYVEVAAVRLGAALGEAPVWDVAVQELRAGEYQDCLDDIREAIAQHDAGG